MPHMSVEWIVWLTVGMGVVAINEAVKYARRRKRKRAARIAKRLLGEPVAGSESEWWWRELERQGIIQKVVGR